MVSTPAAGGPAALGHEGELDPWDDMVAGGAPEGGVPDAEPPDSSWNDGLIARRARPMTVAGGADPTRGETVDDPSGRAPRPPAPAPAVERDTPEADALRTRLEALRQLVVLSRTRLDAGVLAEASRVLDEAAARQRMSSAYTVVAIAGATGGGKSALFNALAGARLSEVGVRRPTTAQPVACVWQEEDDVNSPDGLLDRLGVAPRARRRVWSRNTELSGLVLIDLPDHDSAVGGRREQVDRMLELVDAVIWVVDPEKYADALLHERYLRPLAGYAEVTYIVLNQVDRLLGDAVDQVLHDLRRLLDEDGMALGEHGEPGATVLPLSTVTGEGVEELREALGGLAARRVAPARRLAADVEGAVARLRSSYVSVGRAGRAGMTERSREEFEDWLASAVGATAVGQAAEHGWLRRAERVCGTPWLRLLRRCRTSRGPWSDRRLRDHPPALSGAEPPADGADPARAAAPEAAGVPGARTAGRLGERAPAATATSSPATERADARVVARPVVAYAVQTLADDAAAQLPEPWARTVREAAWRGARGLPEALEEALAGPDAGDLGPDEATARLAPSPHPRWWTVARSAQGLLMSLQLLGVCWLSGVLLGVRGLGHLPLPLLVVLGATISGPLLAWGCRLAATGPARAYGRERERRLRELTARCGRSRVLEPVAAELLRYREVREQYVIAAGGAEALPRPVRG